MERTILKAASTLVARWLIKQDPDRDVEVTDLAELGDEECGVLITVGDEDYRLTVERVSS